MRADEYPLEEFKSQFNPPWKETDFPKIAYGHLVSQGSSIEGSKDMTVREFSQSDVIPCLNEHVLAQRQKVVLLQGLLHQVLLPDQQLWNRLKRKGWVWEKGNRCGLSVEGRKEISGQYRAQLADQSEELFSRGLRAWREHDNIDIVSLAGDAFRIRLADHLTMGIPYCDHVGDAPDMEGAIRRGISPEGTERPDKGVKFIS